MDIYYKNETLQANVSAEIASSMRLVAEDMVADYLLRSFTPFCFVLQRLSGASLLILANKQDIKGALTPAEIAKVRLLADNCFLVISQLLCLLDCKN